MGAWRAIGIEDPRCDVAVAKGRSPLEVRIRNRKAAVRQSDNLDIELVGGAGVERHGSRKRVAAGVVAAEVEIGVAGVGSRKLHPGDDKAASRQGRNRGRKGAQTYGDVHGNEGVAWRTVGIEDGGPDVMVGAEIAGPAHREPAIRQRRHVGLRIGTAAGIDAKVERGHLTVGVDEAGADVAAGIDAVIREGDDRAAVAEPCHAGFVLQVRHRGLTVRSEVWAAPPASTIRPPIYVCVASAPGSLQTPM